MHTGIPYIGVKIKHSRMEEQKNNGQFAASNQ